jgi:ketopantoate reductase
MKLMFVGAGAVGGYFGGRLVQAHAFKAASAAFSASFTGT